MATPSIPPEKISFTYGSIKHDLTLRLASEPSKDTVKIGGRNYQIVGSEESISSLRKHMKIIKPNLTNLGSFQASLAEISSTEKTRSVFENTSVTCERVADEQPMSASLSSKATMKKAYKELTKKLNEYAEKYIGTGALLVQVVGVEGAEVPKTYGQLSVSDTRPVDGNTIGRTGSGAKLWAGLLSTIITKKYSKHIKMKDTLGKFAPTEALRKFGTLSPNGRETIAPQLAEKMSLEAIVGMTAGLEYEDRSPKESGSATLDEIMRGPEAIKDGSIHLVYDPRDKVSVYSNNISLTAYPIEKAYKKVIADKLVAAGELDENQTLRELSQNTELLRTKLTKLIKLNEQIGKAEKHLQRLKYQRDHTRSGSSGKAKKSSLNTQIEAYEKRLKELKSNLKKLPPPIPESDLELTLKKLPPLIPESILDFTLKDLLDSDSAYVGPQKFYEQIRKAEKHLERLKYQRDHTRSGSSGRAKKSSLNTQIEAHEKRLEGLKSNLNPIQGAYVYDLIDQFLMKFDPTTLKTTNHHLVSYDEIMKRELLDPMGMSNSGFHGTEGTEMAVTFINPETKQQESKAPPHENVMLHAAGGGRTTLADASKLAQGLANKEGLVYKDADKNEVILLSQDDLNYLFSPHGHYKGWGLGGSELSCNGKFIEKGGSFDQDTYTFWIDRSSGVGLIAMCNCGKRPVHILEAFKKQVKKISHPNVQDIPREKEETPIEITIDDYDAHPLENPIEYYEGTRGKIALLFNPDKVDEGIMHWSGTPLQLVKQKDDGSGERRFRITTPGRFENVEVWKVKGAKSNQDYLAVGDTSFIKTTIDNIPTKESVSKAKEEFQNFAGDYINSKRPEWGIFRFDVKGEGENIYLCACDVEDKSQKKASTPLGIIKVEKNAISFNGHDRQPPDKIFRFVRSSETAPWRLQVTDVASPEIVIEERTKQEADE